MRRARFDNLKNAALRNAEQNGDWLDSQHRFAAIGANCLSDWRLANNKSSFGDDELFKISFDLHFAFYRK
jgi:hypothetical protein